MTKAEKQNRLDNFIRTNFAMYEDGVSTLKMVELVMGEADLLAEFNYFAEERQDREDFIHTLKEICQARADEYNEQADRLEMLKEKLLEQNTYECGDRPKINY